MAAATHILEWSASGEESLSIEEYPLTSVVPFNEPYARLIVFPSSANAIVNVDNGSVEIYQKNVLHFIYREAISFSGESANASHRIDVLVGFIGYFFNGKGQHIEPTFTVKNGVLFASEECYGKGFLTYKTRGDVWSWTAAYTPETGYITPPGITAYAFHPEQAGNVASYEIPSQDVQDANREDLLVVYREVVVQGANKFEMPDDWPNTNDYADYPGAITSDKPVIGDAYSIWEFAAETIFAEDGGLYKDNPAQYWYAPSTPNAFTSVVWKLQNNIPDAPTDTVTQTMIDRLNNIVIPRLQEDYPGLA